MALAAGALFLCYALFFPKPAPNAQAPPRPLSDELGPAGYQAAWRWLSAERVPVAVWRERFDRLAGNTARSARGNVLLTTLPHELPVRSGEATQLDAWIERGNTLVVAAALDDTPAWALAGSGRLVKDLGRLTRLKFDTVDQPAVTQLVEQRDIVILPRGIHPLMQGVRTLRVASDFPASRWHAVPMDNSGILQIAQTEGGEGAIWVKRQGEGQVITLAVAGLFSNREIGIADNAKLLSNIVAWSLKDRGAVIFDDAHQGSVSYYDAKAFYADPRLHRTLAWLVLVWLVFVLGVQRLRAHIDRWRPADITAFVSTSGDFFAASVTPAAAGSRLLANFFNAIRRRLGAAEDGVPMWEWLAAQATVSLNEVQELRDLHRQIQQGRRFDLTRLQNLLSLLQGKII
ncbi:MAG TPA: DUF4350 domain-containing protein [Steroidobacteraceae bacterium]|nr:DUF4350 domain-containing protein [Steroidobacteraceae bacterium]